MTEMVIASRPVNDVPTKHVYLVKWQGYLHEENTWESFENVNENARELLEEYHAENSNFEKDTRFGKENLREKETEGAEKKKSRKRKML
jgi:hypothetical protein